MTITTQQGEFAVALQYGKYEDGAPAPQKAQASVVFLSQPSDADTLTITGIVYRFKTTPAAINDILIGTALADTLTNLLAAIKGTTSSGYFTGTQPLANVVADLGTNALFLEAYNAGQAGNSLTLTQLGGSSARYTLVAFSGGVNGGDARYSQGAVAIAAMPLNAETLVVGVTTYTFSTASNAGNNIQVNLAGQNTPQLLASVIATRLASNAAVITPTYEGSVVRFKNATAGVAGNSTVLTESVVSATALVITGAGTLTGGADASVFAKTALTWVRLRSRDVDYADNQMQEVIPLEIGGTLTPTGAYKAGVNVQGGAQVMPRLESSLGVLLLATLGKVVTTNPSAGVYQHVFTFQTNEINQPWLAARRMLPGRDNVFGNGIIGYDNKVNLLRTTVAAASPVEMLLQLMGRVPEMDNHPETWLGNSYEDYRSIPLACNSNFSMPTVDGLPSPLPVTQAIIEMGNVTTTPREEMILGSYFMDDVVTRTRALTVRFVYKWRDAALAQWLFGNQLKATAWSPTPFVTTTSGANYAFDILSTAPNNIAGTTTPYSLRIRANSVFWQPSPIRMRAGDIITMDVMGTVLYDPAAYTEFILTNGTASYAVPSEP